LIFPKIMGVVTFLEMLFFDSYSSIKHFNRKSARG
jgi:hypothetical protein